MALSTNLISQFVKATKDTTTTKKETTLYGEVVIQDGKNYVRLDGSSVLTPVNTNVVIDNGNRVSVMIKNHVATVVGNDTVKSNQISNPLSDDSIVRVDAVIADLINANNINANKITASNAEINTLKTANATVQGTLKAHQAVIDDLDATYARLDELDARYITTEELEASYITAGEIDANYAKISELESTYATIENLTAVEGDITTLNSEVATIDNLIFGSATGNVIQTSFSNAVIAQLGDAQIKSAMIESISASKITAGTINSNEVNIVSEDNALHIVDGTIQIKDEDKNVRVQLGKDGDSNYSIAIYDANGDVVFTEGGFEQPIIRDDMVSDTANIHASKLDIDSLFDEINEDGSNTIKSTKVYLDEEKQTLDVAFKSLTTNVTNQGETISSQGTAISTIQGQISSKIWQQDINTATDEMSTQYSTLEQEIDSINTTVASHTAEFNSLMIGGRNILLDSRLEGDNIQNLWSGGGVTKSDGYMEFKRDTVGSTRSFFSQYSSVNPLLSDLEVGSAYTISIDLKKIDDMSIPEQTTVFWRLNYTDTGYYEITINIDSTEVTSEWKRFYATAVLTSQNGKTFSNTTHFTVALGTDIGGIAFRRAKIEKGSRPTDWTPAPEDTETEITNLDARITSTESSITQLSDSITANVTETTNLGTRMTTVEQTADSLSVELENLEIGSRNLLCNSDTYYNNSDYKIAQYAFGDEIPIEGEQYTLIIKGSLGSDRQCFNVYNSGGVVVFCTLVDIGNGLYSATATWKNTNSSGTTTVTPSLINIYQYPSSGTTTSIIEWAKLVKGSKICDWTPAPEDVESDIIDACKTATNYLNFSSSGLVIGDLTSDTLGKNVLIDSDSVDIRNGTTTLASFGADYLYLAKNSRNAKIDLCNGLAQLYHQSKYSYDTLFIIDTPNATEIQGTYNPLCVTSTVSGKVSIQFANSSGVIGSIGMVESGTESYITRNHPSTAATYSILDTGNYYKLMDSGWINCTLNTDSFTRYSNDIPQPQVRKIGKQVYLRGEAKPVVAVTPESDSDTVIATIPEGYWPAQRKQFIMQGSGSYRWMMSIHTDGRIAISRYSNTTTANMNIAAGSWLCCHAQWLID